MKAVLLVGMMTVTVLLVIAACGSESPAPSVQFNPPVQAPVPTPSPTPVPTPVPVRTMSFEVQANSGYEVKITTAAGARLELQFQSDLDITFRLLAPNGEDVGRWERVETLTEVHHTSSYSGEYRLEFDNTFSLFTPKKVTLDYRVVASGWTVRLSEAFCRGSTIRNKLVLVYRWGGVRLVALCCGLGALFYFDGLAVSFILDEDAGLLASPDWDGFVKNVVVVLAVGVGAIGIWRMERWASGSQLDYVAGLGWILPPLIVFGVEGPLALFPG